MRRCNPTLARWNQCHNGRSNHKTVSGRTVVLGFNRETGNSLAAAGSLDDIAPDPFGLALAAILSLAPTRDDDDPPSENLGNEVSSSARQEWPTDAAVAFGIAPTTDEELFGIAPMREEDAATAFEIAGTLAFPADSTDLAFFSGSSTKITSASSSEDWISQVSEPCKTVSAIL